ncbi:MAG TPA: hypothetical protein VIC35_03910 [Acidimicrobiia bacterium]
MTDQVSVDLTHDSRPVNDGLLGLVWNTGSDLSALAPIHPPTVRIDASLQDASPAPGQLDLTNLLAKVAKVRAIGAEPLVILSYMPRWLGQARAGTGDPTRFGPSDLDTWESLVTQVVRTLATAPEPAYQFEVWNEPDIFIFWGDTQQEFIDMALRTHRAVATVKRETGLPLQIGGPAFGFSNSNPDAFVPYLQAVAQAGLPLDFISWHKYANSPFLGPDGPEGNLPDSLYQLLAKRNPDTTPLQYSSEIAQMRATFDSALQGTGLHPRLIIDEWNVSAGGYDLRNDTSEGAALDAGILVEMERAGLDGANIYRAVSGNTHAGDWGIVSASGTPKPTWWVFRAWRDMTGSLLGTQGDDAATGLWARASRDHRDGCVKVLLANFIATGSPARNVRVSLRGKLIPCAGRPFSPHATLSVLNGTSTTLAAHEIAVGRDQSVTVPMGSQSVAYLQVGCTR